MTSLLMCRSDARDFRILQVTFSAEGFMTAVHRGLLKYIGPGHFHWLAALRQQFQYEATAAVACVSVTSSRLFRAWKY